jgi:hypothetical protein
MLRDKRGMDGGRVEITERRDSCSHGAMLLLLFQKLHLACTKLLMVDTRGTLVRTECLKMHQYLDVNHIVSRLDGVEVIDANEEGHLSG